MAKKLRFSQIATDLILKMVWSIALVGTLGLIIVKLINPKNLESTRMEYLLLALIVFFIIPYLGRLEAFGIKVEIRKVVEDLDARCRAIPDYILGSEYHDEEDFQLAELCYQNSLDKDAHFWPAKLNLGAIAQDKKKFDEAISWYKSILKDEGRDEDETKDIYAHNNLADVYLYSDEPYRDPKLALYHAEQTIELCPGMGSAYQYKAEALNRLNRYDEAIPLLLMILDKRIMPSQEHWTRYELMLAQCQKGEHVDLNKIKDMYRLAMSNGEGEYFLEMFESEKGLFPKIEWAKIEKFLASPGFEKD